ncbi:succinate-CoA ligase beta subunit [Schizosaccharomyces cryophilus OY26]|uniref:Succinate--CoA ligase [ADP-forming] subunit beta, mitochondrial n=1 Tax=Schizosaccharomyces cryophilus (strain OY26 / ATCC MYA-4695 / CBS 11777 / NBRC 106824 / NRRL Y48691) TaxID=653667 RepID=S9VYE1_SCHCR|nr:succinate-CoA ligase beta subunit [Schizosaccharomyces cryophilus OY26]EPY51284.1 succinate-CoA ligase beta subunit [Schizosaccharomyces cryophilus OY26]
MLSRSILRKTARTFTPHVQKRNLALHEYLSHDVLRKFDVDVPRGGVARTGEEAEKVARNLGVSDLVVKAQVLAGGRGKGQFESGLRGGVRPVYDPTEARMFSEQMIGHKLITKQTGPAGKPCNSVYVCERKYVRREYYFAILMNRDEQCPMIVASDQGGVDIEGVAAENPSAIIKRSLPNTPTLDRSIADEVVTKLGFTPACKEQAIDAITKLYKVFNDCDATQVEINPLAETTDQKVLCMDAKLSFDDNAEFRHPDIFAQRDITQEDPDEAQAGKVGLNFIKLDGNIGCLVNGAGLAMATMDIIKLHGGEPANFLDVGGNANAEAIRKAFSLITKDNKTTAIFVNIFGGIVRCDVIAQGLISVVSGLNLNIPIICRLQGTNQDAAKDVINNSGLRIFSFDDLDEAAQKACRYSRVVEMAREANINVSFELPL